MASCNMSSTITTTYDPKGTNFYPYLQNPTTHLRVLRQPGHRLAHHSAYLCPARNISETYVRHLQKQAEWDKDYNASNWDHWRLKYFTYQEKKRIQIFGASLRKYGHDFIEDKWAVEMKKNEEEMEKTYLESYNKIVVDFLLRYEKYDITEKKEVDRDVEKAILLYRVGMDEINDMRESENKTRITELLQRQYDQAMMRKEHFYDAYRRVVKMASNVCVRRSNEIENEKRKEELERSKLVLEVKLGCTIAKMVALDGLERDPEDHLRFVKISDTPGGAHEVTFVGSFRENASIDLKVQTYTAAVERAYERGELTTDMFVVQSNWDDVIALVRKTGMIAMMKKSEMKYHEVLKAVQKQRDAVDIMEHQSGYKIWDAVIDSAAYIEREYKDAENRTRLEREEKWKKLCEEEEAKDRLEEELERLQEVAFEQERSSSEKEDQPLKSEEWLRAKLQERQKWLNENPESAKKNEELRKQREAEAEQVRLEEERNANKVLLMEEWLRGKMEEREKWQEERARLLKEEEELRKQKKTTDERVTLEAERVRLELEKRNQSLEDKKIELQEEEYEQERLEGETWLKAQFGKRDKFMIEQQARLQEEIWEARLGVESLRADMSN